MGDKGKGLKHNRKSVAMVIGEVRQTYFYCDKHTCVPTDMSLQEFEFYPKLAKVGPIKFKKGVQNRVKQTCEKHTELINS